MASYPECQRLAHGIILSATILIIILVGILTGVLTKNPVSNVNSGTYGKGCNEYTYNSNTGEVECVKQNKRSGKWRWYVTFIIWTVVLLILILKKACSNIQKSPERHPRRRQSWVLERPVVAISTVSRDYSIGSTTTGPSAPPHASALPPSEEDAPPPEYLPPPAYNECVINMGANFCPQSNSSLTRII